MNLLVFATLAVSCLLSGQPNISCMTDTNQPIVSSGPVFTGSAIDVIVSADSYLVWDIKTGSVLKEKNDTHKRPVASLSKLATVLAARELLKPDDVVTIPPEVKTAQRLGANVKLPVGEHIKVRDLLAAALIPSANDAAVTLAVASKGSEDDFVTYVNTTFLPNHGLVDTRLANASGLSGGDQYSDVHDLQQLLLKAYRDPLLGPFLSTAKGSYTTLEGTTRSYETTDKLLGSYLPVLAAKTGYTTDAKENLVLITKGAHNEQIGVILLGSDDRFQDMKILVEWIWRNYTWN